MYFVTLVQRNSAGETASVTTVYNSKKAALEKFFYEMYYATNQNLAYTLCTIMDEDGAIHKSDVFRGEAVTE